MKTEEERVQWLLDNGVEKQEATKLAKAELSEALVMRISLSKNGDVVPASFDFKYNKLGAKRRTRFRMFLGQGRTWKEALFKAATPKQIFQTTFGQITASDLSSSANINSLLIDSLVASQYTRFEANKIVREGMGEELDGTFPVRIAHKLYPKIHFNRRDSAAAHLSIMSKRNKVKDLNLRPQVLKHFCVFGYFLIPCVNERSVELLKQLVANMNGSSLIVIGKHKAKRVTYDKRPIPPMPHAFFPQTNPDCSEALMDPIITAIVGSYINDENKFNHNGVDSNSNYDHGRYSGLGGGGFPYRPVTSNNIGRYEGSRGASRNSFGNGDSYSYGTARNNVGMNMFNDFGNPGSYSGGNHGNSSYLARNLFNF